MPELTAAQEYALAKALVELFPQWSSAPGRRTWIKTKLHGARSYDGQAPDPSDPLNAQWALDRAEQEASDLWDSSVEVSTCKLRNNDGFVLTFQGTYGHQNFKTTEPSKMGAVVEMLRKIREVKHG